MDGLSLGAELCPGCRLAKTDEGALAIAIRVAKTGSSARRQLENLTYLPPRKLEVSGAHGVRIEELALLVCRTHDAHLQDAFLRIATSVLGGDESQLTERELDARIDDLVRLFRALGKPAKQTVQGLWAELAVIIWSAEPRRAVTHWHSSARAQHDFDGGADRLEVKSCGTGLREHAVRLDRLRAMPDGRTLFASVLVGEEAGGVSVSGLVEAIMSRVENRAEVRRRLQTIITQSLGSDWREADVPEKYERQEGTHPRTRERGSDAALRPGSLRRSAWPGCERGGGGRANLPTTRLSNRHSCAHPRQHGRRQLRARRREPCPQVSTGQSGQPARSRATRANFRQLPFEMP